MVSVVPPRMVRTREVVFNDIKKLCRVLFGEYMKMPDGEYCSIPATSLNKTIVIKRALDGSMTEVHYRVKTDTGEEFGAEYTKDHKYVCKITRKVYSAPDMLRVSDPLEQYIIDCRVGDVTISGNYMSPRPSLVIYVNGKLAAKTRSDLLKIFADSIQKDIFSDDDVQKAAPSHPALQDREGFEVVE